MTDKDVDNVITIVSLKYREYLSKINILRTEIRFMEDRVNDDNITVKRYNELKFDLEAKLEELSKKENIATGISIAREEIMDKLIKPEV